MCNFKSYVVTKDGVFHFYDGESHAEIVKLMSEKGIVLADDGLGSEYVMIEVTPETNYSVKFDAPLTKRPDWFTVELYDYARELTIRLKNRQTLNGKSPVSDADALPPNRRREVNAKVDVFRSELNAVDNGSAAINEQISQLRTQLEAILSSNNATIQEFRAGVEAEAIADFNTYLAGLSDMSAYPGYLTSA